MGIEPGKKTTSFFMDNIIRKEECEMDQCSTLIMMRVKCCQATDSKR